MAKYLKEWKFENIVQAFYTGVSSLITVSINSMFSLLEFSSQVFRCHSGTYFENAMTLHDYLKASNKVIWQGI